jgi:hypothetical protein
MTTSQSASGQPAILFLSAIAASNSFPPLLCYTLGGIVRQNHSLFMLE